MYDLHRLGWNSFQQLCLTIAREVLGQTPDGHPNSPVYGHLKLPHLN